MKRNRPCPASPRSCSTRRDPAEWRSNEAKRDNDNALPETVGRMLKSKRKTLSVAESCTGGNISNMITNVPGSSGYFIMGIVAYDNRVKSGILGIKPEIIRKYGAVSKEIARLMAENVRRLAGADIGLGVTGIAGPSGGTKEKPVGLVYIALTMKKRRVAEELRLSGSRKDIKLKASKEALNLLRLNI